MHTISYTTLRTNLSGIMDRIAKNREAVHITRKGHENMVMIAESDLNEMQETLYLLSNPKNAARLYESFKQAENGEFEDVTFDED